MFYRMLVGTGRIFIRILGSSWVYFSVILVMFLVSGLMYEVIYYYLLCEYFTWEVMWFFVFYGICVIFEMAVKKVLGGRWRLYSLVFSSMTAAFVGVSGVWLFFLSMISYGLD